MGEFPQEINKKSSYIEKLYFCVQVIEKLETLHTLTIHERVKAPSPTVNPKPHNFLLVEETLELPGQLRRSAEPP